MISNMCYLLPIRQLSTQILYNTIQHNWLSKSRASSPFSWDPVCSWAIGAILHERFACLKMAMPHCATQVSDTEASISVCATHGREPLTTDFCNECFTHFRDTTGALVKGGLKENKRNNTTFRVPVLCLTQTQNGYTWTHTHTHTVLCDCIHISVRTYAQ